MSEIISLCTFRTYHARRSALWHCPTLIPPLRGKCHVSGQRTAILICHDGNDIRTGPSLMPNRSMPVRVLCVALVARCGLPETEYRIIYTDEIGLFPIFVNGSSDSSNCLFISICNSFGFNLITLVRFAFRKPYT